MTRRLNLDPRARAVPPWLTPPACCPLPPAAAHHPDLWKLSNSYLGGFQKRWFQLHSGRLEWFKHAAGAHAAMEGRAAVEPLGAVPVSSIKEVFDHFAGLHTSQSKYPELEFQFSGVDGVAAGKDVVSDAVAG
eukprot:SAG22_NODE_3850_length_1502_cov_1.397719_2_plen_133_part_00